MDATIKSIRPNKPSDRQPESRPAELDPSEFLAAAVRADQPRPARAEAEQAVKTLLAYIGENTNREGLLDTPRRVVEAFDELYQATTSARPRCSIAPSARPPAMMISSLCATSSSPRNASIT